MLTRSRLSSRRSKTGLPPLRSREHELLVQETLMRCTGGLAG